MTGTTKTNAGHRGKTARAWACGIVTAAVLLSPAKGWTMAADGALITNIVAATYHGMGGYPWSGNTFAPKYTMSYLATATILVSCPVVSITKRASTTVQAVSGTVTFEICAINSSLNASAWNITITDRLLDNTEYVLNSFANWSGGGIWTPSSASVSAGPWVNTQPLGGQDSPYYLRWTISTIAPGRSACISFQAVVL